MILGSVLAFMSVGMAVSLILKKMGRKDEGKKFRGKETVFPEYGEKVPVEDPDIKRTEEKTGSRTFTEVSDVPQENSELFGETVVLSSNPGTGPASLVSREPGELATIYLRDDITVIGKLETAADAVIPVMTVSRLHAKIRKKEENFFLSDLNSRNGTTVNGRLLQGDEEYQLQNEDEVDFAQARYIFLK
ncbi:MAG: FHA domain-containing protein [Clostridiales bacterium]|nr:FHA domain-containing protein [Clostridiales bacterium]